MHTLTGAFPRKGIAMDTATEKVTPRQRHRLNQLLLSSVFTAEEAHRTAVWMASPGATKERASEVIDDALARFKKRKEAQKASADRKAEFHASKENGNGEYSPRRYSNENPPTNGKPANEPPPEPPPETPPAPAPEAEPTTYRINGVDYTDKNEAAEAASKAIFG